jgi:phosphatidylinositol glycan class O
VAQRLWEVAIEQHTSKAWAAAYASFATYQSDSLTVYRGLWTAFDLVSMGKGIVISGLGTFLLLFYLKVTPPGGVEIPPQSFKSASMTKRVLVGSSAGFLYTLSLWACAKGAEGLTDCFVFQTTIGGLVGAVTCIPKTNNRPLVLSANSSWSYLSVLFILSQTIGFASNSYTVWEDNVLLFFQATFGFLAAFRCLRQPNPATRTYGVYQSILFTMLGRVAFYSQRCREEQMPDCHTTYFGSSGYPAFVQNIIPLGIAVLLPMIVKRYLSAHTYRVSLIKTRLYGVRSLPFCSTRWSGP